MALTVHEAGDTMDGGRLTRAPLWLIVRLMFAGHPSGRPSTKFAKTLPAVPFCVHVTLKLERHTTLLGHLMFAGLSVTLAAVGAV